MDHRLKYKNKMKKSRKKTEVNICELVFLSFLGNGFRGMTVRDKRKYWS